MRTGATQLRDHVSIEEVYDLLHGRGYSVAMLSVWWRKLLGAALRREEQLLQVRPGHALQPAPLLDGEEYGVNGWRFWSVQGAEPQGKEGCEKPETQASKLKRLVYRVPNQKGIAEGQSRWFCRACMKGFVASGGGQPGVCPEGHRE